MKLNFFTLEIAHQHTIVTVTFNALQSLTFIIRCIIASYAISNTNISYSMSIFAIAILIFYNSLETLIKQQEDSSSDILKIKTQIDQLILKQEDSNKQLATNQAHLEQSYKCDVSNLTARVESLVTENEKLHKQLGIIAFWADMSMAINIGNSKNSYYGHPSITPEKLKTFITEMTNQQRDKNGTYIIEDNGSIISGTIYIPPKTMPIIAGYGEAILEKLNTKINECD